MRIDRFKRAARDMTLLAAGALTLASLISSCSDQPTEGSTKAYNPLALITGGAAEISFNNLDAADVQGLTKVYRGVLNDDGVTVADQTYTSLWGVFGSDAGPVHVNYCRAAGVEVPEETGGHTRINMAPQAAIVEGADVRWETQWPDGVSLTGSVQLPFVPTVTNVAPYQNVSAGRDLTITTANSVAGGEAVITIFYDPVRTKAKGLDNPPLTINDVPKPRLTWVETTEDDGTLTIPAAELGKLVKNKVYLLTIQRFRYVVRPSSLDSRKVGLGAISEYTTPIIIGS